MRVKDSVRLHVRLNIFATVFHFICNHALTSV